MKKWIVSLRDQVWVIPAFYSILALALAAFIGYVDFKWTDSLSGVLPSIFFTELDLAQTILSSLLTALLTVTTFTFSTIMVVLTTYSSQFSPRTVKNFITDRLTLRVLGIFMGGFIYSTMSLQFMKATLDSQPLLAGTIGIMMAILCVVFFAIFIHHVSTNIRVSNLIDRLTSEADEVIRHYVELDRKQEYMLCTTSKMLAEKGEAIISEEYGYIQYIDYLQLRLVAERHNIVVDVLVPAGEYVIKTTVIAQAKGDADWEKVSHAICSCFVIKNERDVRQDPQFALQKLSEVALRAISPGINDPNTANDCIRHLGRLLGNLSRVSDDGWFCVTKNGETLVRFSLPTYEHHVYKTFYQLIHYGKEDVSVIEAVLDALYYAAQHADGAHRQSVKQMVTYLEESIDREGFPALDQQLIDRKKTRVLEV